MRPGTQKSPPARLKLSTPTLTAPKFITLCPHQSLFRRHSRLLHAGLPKATFAEVSIRRSRYTSCWTVTSRQQWIFGNSLAGVASRLHIPKGGTSLKDLEHCIHCKHQSRASLFSNPREINMRLPSSLDLLDPEPYSSLNRGVFVRDTHS